MSMADFAAQVAIDAQVIFDDLGDTAIIAGTPVTVVAQELSEQLMFEDEGYLYHIRWSLYARPSDITSAKQYSLVTFRGKEYRIFRMQEDPTAQYVRIDIGDKFGQPIEL